MADEKPVVYILHGNDEQAIGALLENLVSRLGDSTTVDLNLSRLDGRQASEAEVVTAATALPFLAERRMVILRHPLARLESKEKQDHFSKLLDGLPATTALVLVIEDTPEKRGEWTILKKHKWLRQWAEKAGKRVHFQTCSLPDARDMTGWIQNRVQKLGGKFTVDAARALANHTGNDTRMADLEIQKMLIYVDYARTVEVEDVEELATGSQSSIFAMVDSLAAGNTTAALTQLHRLLEQTDGLILFGMIVRQFRLLLQTREILDEGGSTSQVQSELRLQTFLADKLISQARRFSLPELERIYHRLLQMDEAMKTSQGTTEVLLDTFFVEVNLT